MLMKYFTVVSEPYEYEKENALTGELEILKKTSDAINEERSLLKLLNKFDSKNDKE